MRITFFMGCGSIGGRNSRLRRKMACLKLLPMKPLAVVAVRFFATVGCGSRVTGPAAEVVTDTVDSMNGGMKHCRDAHTGIEELSCCSAFCWFVDCTSL